MDLFKESFRRFRTLKYCLNDETGKDKVRDSCHINLSIHPDIILNNNERTLQSNYNDIYEHNFIKIFDHEECLSPFFGLIPAKYWKVYLFKSLDGLIFIRNPFTPEGQRYWISKCLKFYPQEPENETNISNLQKQKLVKLKTNGTDVSEKAINSLNDNQNHQSEQLDEINPLKDEPNFYQKLRWVTFGYHHNWDTKIYTESFKSEFPQDLFDLTKYISLVLGFNDFRAEAAIINYYNLNSTLYGHQDTSEINQEAPLFSISFGQSAVFLIGGETKEIEPLPLLLTSGDIVVMSSQSRKSYHGVPKILKSTNKPWIDTESMAKEVDLSSSIIETDEPSSSKKFKKSPPSSDSDHNCKMCDIANKFNSLNENNINKIVSKWDQDPFLSQYVNTCRINLNVRQVH